MFDKIYQCKYFLVTWTLRLVAYKICLSSKHQILSVTTCYLNLDDMKLTLATNGFYNVVCSFCQITLCRWIACMQMTLYMVVGTRGEGGTDSGHPSFRF